MLNSISSRDLTEGNTDSKILFIKKTNIPNCFHTELSRGCDRGCHFCVLSKVFSKYNAFAHPLRYDYAISISNNLTYNDYKAILNKLKKATPVPISKGVSSSEKPKIAEIIAKITSYIRFEQSFLWLGFWFTAKSQME